MATQETYATDKEMAARYKVSRATLWRWVRDGDFPSPIKLSPRCTRFKLTDAEKWEATRREAC